MSGCVPRIIRSNCSSSSSERSSSTRVSLVLALETDSVKGSKIMGYGRGKSYGARKSFPITRRYLRRNHGLLSSLRSRVVRFRVSRAISHLVDENDALPIAHCQPSFKVLDALQVSACVLAISCSSFTLSCQTQELQRTANSRLRNVHFHVLRQTLNVLGHLQARSNLG